MMADEASTDVVAGAAASPALAATTLATTMAGPPGARPRVKPEASGATVDKKKKKGAKGKGSGEASGAASKLSEEGGISTPVLEWRQLTPQQCSVARSGCVCTSFHWMPHPSLPGLCVARVVAPGGGDVHCLIEDWHDAEKVKKGLGRALASKSPLFFTNDEGVRAAVRAWMEEEEGSVIGWNFFDDQMMELPRWPTLWGARVSPSAPSVVVERFRALMLEIAQGPKPGEFEWLSMENGLMTVVSDYARELSWAEGRRRPVRAVRCPVDFWGVDWKRPVMGRRVEEVVVAPVVEREEGGVLEVEVPGAEVEAMELGEVVYKAPPIRGPVDGAMKKAVKDARVTVREHDAGRRGGRGRRWEEVEVEDERKRRKVERERREAEAKRVREEQAAEKRRKQEE